DNAKNYLEELIYKLKIIMLLLGKQNIVELQSTKYKIVGDLKELI
ncbi:MAG: type 2 isopentenyl-diphosphate Delta-isomerase, partial [Tissierellia bacterium]|nr:type 2 isopentenyl-diphosphate Delta-isomerase [Tissierellia bacterium]